jgi:hypothetical protein
LIVAYTQQLALPFVIHNSFSAMVAKALVVSEPIAIFHPGDGKS